MQSVGCISERVLRVAQAPGERAYQTPKTNYEADSPDSCEVRRLYGSPKITQILRKEDGERVSQKMVANIMRENELRIRTVRKYKATTDSNHNYPVHGNVLNQTFVAQRLNQVYMADITYIPTDEGWVYLASLMDLYSRKIVGWHADARMTKELCITALEQAFKR